MIDPAISAWAGTAIIAWFTFIVGIMVGLELYPDRPKPPQEKTP